MIYHLRLLLEHFHRLHAFHDYRIDDRKQLLEIRCLILRHGRDAGIEDQMLMCQRRVRLFHRHGMDRRVDEKNGERGRSTEASSPYRRAHLSKLSF